MKKIQMIFQKISIKEKYIPFLFLIIAVLGFGLQANRLGYYQDDWPYVFYAFNKGIPSLSEALFYDSRPNAAWLYIFLFNVLGFKPLAWQIAAMVFRWLTATVLWYFLKTLWPQNSRQVTFAIALFIVHPFFLIQPAAVNSMLYWAGFLLFALSVFIMAYSATYEKYQLLPTCIAVLLEGVHLFTSEYFVGATLIRPFVLFWIISRQTDQIKKVTAKVISYWVPYLAMLAVYIIWRLFLFTPSSGGDRNSPAILYELLNNPTQAIPRLIQIGIQDSIIVTVTSWYKTLTPNIFQFDSLFSRANLMLGFMTFALIYFYLTRINRDEEQLDTPRWFASPFLLGLLIVFLSLVPIWMIGQDISTHVNQYAASRFGIVTTLGASLILAVLIENSFGDYKRKVLAVSLLTALAINMHVGNENLFAHSWEKQENLYRQLLWRAPHIESGTAIVTDEEVLGFMGHYAVSFGITSAYQPGNIQTPPYWYFPFYYTNPNTTEFLAGTPLEEGRLSMRFNGSSKQYLLLSFNPEQNRCLWVLQPEDANLQLVSKDMRTVSLGSDIGLIKNNEAVQKSLPESIFGPQNDLDHWCYYFQKADLARQYEQWDEIPILWDGANSHGVHADNGYEYIPFIEGYGHRGDWEQMALLTKSANKITSALEPSLCSMIDRLVIDTPKSETRDSTINKLKNDLECEKYQ